MSEPSARANDYGHYQATILGQGEIHSLTSQASNPRHSRPAERASFGHYAYSRPQLKSHQSFPQSLGTSTSSTNVHGQHQPSEPVVKGLSNSLRANSYQPSQINIARTSRISQSTPPSPDPSHNSAQLENDDIELADLEHPINSDREPMTAAELRAHKRRMKRFRLTHTQSRYLMSEFARQPHPDAAHRERLSREIPGLSPRQVQVWFQNRRAKMKRLTSDDREYILRSRALPEDFDTKQALHGSYGAPTPNLSMQIPPPGFSGSHISKSLVTSSTPVSASGHESYGLAYARSTGNTPALNAFTFTPPQLATAAMSPTSSFSGNDSRFSAYVHNHVTSNNISNGQPGYHPTYNIRHTQGYEPVSRDSSDSHTSLRTWPTSSEPSQYRPQPDSRFFSEEVPYNYDQLQRPNILKSPNLPYSGQPANGLQYAHLSSKRTSETHERPLSSVGIIDTPPYHRSKSYPSAPTNLSPDHTTYPPFDTAVAQPQPHPHTYIQFNPSFEPQMGQRRHTYGILPQQSYNSSMDQFYGMSAMSNGQEVELDNSDGGVTLPSSF